jgi:hypothetical protein
MGSRGNGRFGFYRREGAGALDGSKNGELSCPLEINNIKLEDIAVSDYYFKYHDVLPSESQIELLDTIINKRLVVRSTSTQDIIGNLPISYNYLNLCIKKGYRYSGVVISSGLSPIPYTVVNLYAK